MIETEEVDPIVIINCITEMLYRQRWFRKPE